MLLILLYWIFQNSGSISRSISRSGQIGREIFCEKKNVDTERLQILKLFLCSPGRYYFVRRRNLASYALFLVVTLEFARSFTSLLSVSDILFIIRPRFSTLFPLSSLLILMTMNFLNKTPSLSFAVIHKALVSVRIEIFYLTLKSQVKSRSYVITSNNTRTSLWRSCSEFREEVPLNI